MSDTTTTKHLYDIKENQEKILNNQERLGNMLEFLASGLFRNENITRTTIQHLNDAMETFE